MKDRKISLIKNEINQSYKLVKIKNNKNELKEKNKLLINKNLALLSFILLLLIIIIQFFIIYFSKASNKNNISVHNNKKIYDINFKYEDYDKDLIPDKYNKVSKRMISLEEAQFINGIIRKNKLKKCLEKGVAYGGSSVVILNAIKNIENSVLVSLDIYKEFYHDRTKLTGYIVNKYFPDLAKNWKLYTGDQQHKFLVNLKMKFDFLYLDSSHISPAEIINFIEALPFLNEKCHSCFT